MIHFLGSRATKQELDEMQKALDSYIKLAVDVQKGILVGGGVLHADCEAVLLENDSRQVGHLGSGLIPATQEIRYDALINIRPRQGNPSMKILDPAIRARVAEIVRPILEGV